MEVDILSDKTIITKENLINIISEKCKYDFISTDELTKLIEKYTNEHGILSTKKLMKSIRSSHTKAIIKDVYNILEDLLFECLSCANSEQDVRIKLFEGINLDGVYSPEKTKKNNLTGNTEFVNSKIRPKFNITRTYCEKLNNKDK